MRHADEPATLDETSLAGQDPDTIAACLALSTRFCLGREITPIQNAFLTRNGFIVFAGAAAPQEVERVLAEMDAVERKLLDEGIERVCGVPVWFGTGPTGEPWLQRMGFSSYHSEWLEEFVTDDRFEPVRRLIGADARIGRHPREGRRGVQSVPQPARQSQIEPRLAHRRAARRVLQLAYARTDAQRRAALRPYPPQDGGLRLLPGTHTQSAWSTLFRKVHFVTDDDDPQELAVETWPGDLTVHDGRMWHRVKASPHTGRRSIRRSMYVPYVVDTYQPKDDSTPTNTYMRVFDRVMRLKRQVAASSPRESSVGLFEAELSLRPASSYCRSARWASLDRSVRDKLTVPFG